MHTEFYDIIGDIHGHADQLVELLELLDYQLSNTGYQHRNRKAIFIGDFIDRGNQQKNVLDVVMPMVENNHALAVMGNHEFNALAYHTKHNNEYLRLHTEKNTNQHKAFLEEFKDSEQKDRVLSFFKTLPLWIELDGLRVVHACWHNEHIDALKKQLGGNHLPDWALIGASKEGSLLYLAVETILKGIETEIPNGLTFTDKDGHERSFMRVKWWNSSAQSLSEIALPEGIDLGDAAIEPIPPTIPFYDSGDPLCFVGHYWLEGEPGPLTDNVACVDYSVAKGGKLVAYRWSGETSLDKDNFVSVERLAS